MEAPEAGQRGRGILLSQPHPAPAEEPPTAPTTPPPPPPPPAESEPPDDRPAAGVGPDAFTDLYRAHVDRVYRYLRARTPTTADAEELTSRTFMRAFSSLHTYRGGGAHFGSWLLTIAHNLLANWYRDRGRRPRAEPLDEAQDIADELPGPEASLERSEDIARVRRAIERLPPERQQLIALKYARGLSNAEIGRMMGRTEGAVKALHHRTLRQLEAALGAEPS